MPEGLRELIVAARVDLLEEATVRRCRKYERAERHVVVDDDHEMPATSVAMVVALAAEELVACEVPLERSTELLAEVASRDAEQHVPVGVGQARVAGAPLTTELLDQLLASGHGTILPVEGPLAKDPWITRIAASAERCGEPSAAT